MLQRHTSSAAAASSALLVLVSSAVFAPAALAAPSDFVGLYVGGHLGYGVSSAVAYEYSNGAPSGDFKVKGQVVGAHFGYNGLWKGYIVGIELDTDAADIKGTYVNDAGVTAAGTAKLTRQLSLKGRFGVVVDQFMIYGTAGYAQGKFRFTGGPSPNSGLSPTFVQFSDTLNGWTAGLGFESKLSSRWNTRVEYQYTHFADESKTLAPVYPTVTTKYTHLRPSEIRAGITYRF